MEKEITVRQMLDHRERKVLLQKELQKEHPGSVVVTLSMNIPGPRKNDAQIRRAFEAGTEALQKIFRENAIHVVGHRSLAGQTGDGMFYALSCPGAAFIKKLTIQLEDTHPLGRLYDIDVYWPEGTQISRKKMGIKERRCLLCEREAKLCGRSRAHPVEELQQKVYAIIQEGLPGDDGSGASKRPA